MAKPARLESMRTPAIELQMRPVGYVPVTRYACFVLMQIVSHTAVGPSFWLKVVELTGL